MAEVKNIKISLKLIGCSLDNAISRLNRLNIPHKRFANYITFTEQFTYIYFKSKDGVLNHVNVTKLRSTDDIGTSMNILKELFDVYEISSRIDNIIATYNTGHPINLMKLIASKALSPTKYNPEQFPGLFAKYPEGTVLIFHSGKLVLVGFNTLQSIETVLTKVCATIVKL